MTGNLLKEGSKHPLPSAFQVAAFGTGETEIQVGHLINLLQRELGGVPVPGKLSQVLPVDEDSAQVAVEIGEMNLLEISGLPSIPPLAAKRMAEEEEAPKVVMVQELHPDLLVRTGKGFTGNNNKEGPRCEEVVDSSGQVGPVGGKGVLRERSPAESGNIERDEQLADVLGNDHEINGTPGLAELLDGVDDHIPLTRHPAGDLVDNEVIGGGEEPDGKLFLFAGIDLLDEHSLDLVYLVPHIFEGMAHPVDRNEKVPFALAAEPDEEAELSVDTVDPAKVFLEVFRITEIHLFQKVDLSGAELVPMFHDPEAISVASETTREKRRVILRHEGPYRHILRIDISRGEFIGGNKAVRDL
jgi:hypothetical protein